MEQRWSLDTWDLFISRGGGAQWYLGRDESGACIFLNAAGRCRIHERFGEAAKPLACRLYPFVLTPIGNEAHLGLRYDCPAVMENFGRPLPEHILALRPLISEVMPRGVESLEPPPVKGGHVLPFQHLVRLAQAFDAILARTSISITRRMLACVSFAHLLQASKVGEVEQRPEEFCEVATTVTCKSAEANPLKRIQPPRAISVLFRQLAGVCNRWDRLEETTVPIGHRLRNLRQRMQDSIHLTRGKGMVPRLRADFPQVPFSTLEESFGTPEGACDELLTRYYRVKFAGMDFFGPSYHGYSFVEGTLTLLLTYPVILWAARAYTLNRGATEVDINALLPALAGVDAQHGRSAAFGFANERKRIRVLTAENNLKVLTIWYGS